MLTLMLIGNLGADAKIQEYNGQRFLSMNVAHSEIRKDNASNRVESTQWVSVSSNFVNENLLPYLRRGQKVFVSGKLRTKIFVGNDKMQHVGLNIIADHIELCGAAQQAAPPAPAQAAAPPAAAVASPADDDEPF